MKTIASMGTASTARRSKRCPAKAIAAIASAVRQLEDNLPAHMAWCELEHGQGDFQLTERLLAQFDRQIALIPSDVVYNAHETRKRKVGAITFANGLFDVCAHVGDESIVAARTTSDRITLSFYDPSCHEDCSIHISTPYGAPLRKALRGLRLCGDENAIQEGYAAVFQTIRSIAMQRARRAYVSTMERHDPASISTTRYTRLMFGICNALLPDDNQLTSMSLQRIDGKPTICVITKREYDSLLFTADDPVNPCLEIAETDIDAVSEISVRYDDHKDRNILVMSFSEATAVYEESDEHERIDPANVLLGIRQIGPEVIETLRLRLHAIDAATRTRGA